MPKLAIKHSPGGDSMTDAAFQETEIASRHVHFLRECAYPGPHKRKRLASEWGVSEALARQWLEGKIPTSKYLTRMIARWGRAYVGFVWQGCDWARGLMIDDGLDKAAAQLAALQRQIEELRKA